MLEPPESKDAQRVKSPDAKLTRGGEELRMEVKTATAPPDSNTWSNHAKGANRQIKNANQPGEITFDWTQVDIRAPGSNFPDQASIERFINGKDDEGPHAIDPLLRDRLDGCRRQARGDLAHSHRRWNARPGHVGEAMSRSYGYSPTVGRWMGAVDLAESERAPVPGVQSVLQRLRAALEASHRPSELQISWAEYSAEEEELAFHELEVYPVASWDEILAQISHVSLSRWLGRRGHGRRQHGGGAA